MRERDYSTPTGPGASAQSDAGMNSGSAFETSALLMEEWRRGPGKLCRANGIRQSYLRRGQRNSVLGLARWAWYPKASLRDRRCRIYDKKYMMGARPDLITLTTNAGTSVDWSAERSGVPPCSATCRNWGSDHFFQPSMSHWRRTSRSAEAGAV